VLRHTTAMDLLQEGVEPLTIALWLGHESVETTQLYLDWLTTITLAGRRQLSWPV